VSEDGFVLAKDSLRVSNKLLDSHNMDLVSGVRISTMFQKLEKINPLNSEQSLPQHYQPVSGLYISNILSEEGNSKMQQVYIDRYGRIYSKGLINK